MKRKPTTFSYDRIKALIGSVSDKRDRFMFAVSYANGTRVSEVLGLKAGDITVSGNFIYITTPVLKKRRGGIVRAPPISIMGEPWLAEIILDYVAGKKGVLIGYAVRTAQRRFDAWFDCTAHSFRHTRVTHCLTVLNMPIRMVAEFFRISEKSLGEWIMKYGHLDRDDIKRHLNKRFEKQKEV